MQVTVCESNLLSASFYLPLEVTRTMPIGNGGKFTTEARHIYDLVLEMQKVRIDFDVIEPGN